MTDKVDPASNRIETQPSSFAANMLRGIAYWVCLLLPLFTDGATTLPPISIKGSKLYKPNGDQAHGGQGVNTVRVYEVDSSYSHDGRMEAFDKRGIYIWIDIDSGSTQIDTETPVWNTVMYCDWTSKIDAFARYSNVLAFSVGAELISYSQYGRAAPFVKAAVSDIKAFRDDRGYRRIPIAYSDRDMGACGDYIGYIFDQFAASEIPIVISEVICTEDGENRNFTEVQTFLSTNYSDVFSGAMLYDWTNDTFDWGVVHYKDADYVCEPDLLPAYTRLQSILSSAQPESTAMTSYTPASSAPACPTRDNYSSWLVDENLPPPTLPGLPSVTRVEPNGDPIKPTGGVQGSGKGKPGSATQIATDENAKAASGSSAAFGGLGLGGLIGVIAGSVAGVLALLGLGWFIPWTRRRAQRNAVMDAQGSAAGNGGGPGGEGNESGSDNKNGHYKPTNVYLGPQDISGDGR
ncbi:glycoside hydrolase family 72 protein [Apiospora saccharicola]|uniref:1,3-beta-glucanosyltransferase n=1 Tax=Apiospora saccharicola TaxID=335842 RepID=A0ABR1VAA5_9PEZI